MIDLIGKTFSSKTFFFIISTTLILGLNLTPLILQYRHASAGRTFGLIHNNVQDFYFYQALMNEGGSNAWLTYDPYTSEPHQPSIIFSYFLWLGKLSKLLGLSYALTYHIARIILGVIFLYTVYRILYTLNLPYPRLTYFFFTFAAPFMHTINDYGTLRSVPFMNWWNGIDPIRRAAFLPHHMLGGILLIVSIMLIFKFVSKPVKKYLILLILISAIMAFVHTPSLLILLLILPPSLIIYLLIQKSSSKFSIFNFQFSLNFQSLKIKNSDFISNFKFQISNFIGLLVYWLIGLLFLSAMILQTKSGFPWSQYIDWEKNLQFPLMREFIGALGILLPFSLIGIYHAIKSKKFENIFIACWLVAPFLFIPIAPKFNLSNIRLIQGVPYLPLAILATLGIKVLIDFAVSSKKAIKTRSARWQAGVATQAMTPFRVNLQGEPPMVKESEKSDRTPKLIFLIIFFAFTLPTLSWSLKDQIREYMPIYGNVYLDNRLFDAFKFINNNYPAKTITLSTFYAGNYLPVYTNTVSFIGHFGYTYNEKEKEKETQRFFEGKMTIEEAKNFLVSNKIALIFQGSEEKPLYKDYLYPSLLKIVYDKEAATIYKPNF